MTLAAPSPVPPLPAPRRSDSLSLAAARRIAIAAQGLGGPRAEGEAGRPALKRMVERLGVLQIDFVHDDGSLREVSWDEWFGTFDERRLNFIYQETKSDGSRSTFFRLDSPEREDA